MKMTNHSLWQSFGYWVREPENMPFDNMETRQAANRIVI